MTGTTARQRQHRLAERLGLAGAALGLVAGALQASVGARIPTWTGDKLAPVPLGLLTIGLSVLAGAAAVHQARATLTTGARAACVLGLVGPGLLCFSTVGRLWYVPGLLLLTAGAMSLDDGRDTALAIRRNWVRCLLGVLGAAEVLMALGAAPRTLAVGVAGGLVLIAAASLGPPRAATGALVLVGAAPFAALAWTAVVPVVLLLLAGVLVAMLDPPSRSPLRVRVTTR